jgi:hypothetical protein
LLFILRHVSLFDVDGERSWAGFCGIISWPKGLNPVVGLDLLGSLLLESLDFHLDAVSHEIIVWIITFPDVIFDVEIVFVFLHMGNLTMSGNPFWRILLARQ